MKTTSWKTAPTMPRFLAAAVRKGLKIADTIGVEQGNDKTWLTITFRKLPKNPKNATSHGRKDLEAL